MAELIPVDGDPFKGSGGVTLVPVDGNPFAKKSTKKADEQPESSVMDAVKQGLGNVVAGGIRGAGSIGATLLAPVDAAARALNGGKPVTVRVPGTGIDVNVLGNERRNAMDQGLQSMGADPDALLYKGGKLGAEIAGTAGVGGMLANGARAALPAAVTASPRLAQLLTAIETGGFRTGAPAATNTLAKLADMGVRTVGGAVNGGATAGLVDPSEADSGAVIGAALPGIVKLGQMAGSGVRSGLETGANKLMQSAIKPTINQLKTGDAAVATQTLLDYGISPTKAGVNKLRSLIDDLNTQISTNIAGSNATIDKGAVVNRLGDVVNRFSNQVSPSADLAAIRGVADDFMAHPVYQGASMPVQVAQELKQGTYQTLAKKYGQIGSAETEAQKGLARGLKEEIAQAVPGVQAMNEQESRLIRTLDVAERRALMELNKNPMGLAALAQNPLSWAAFMADRSAAFKALAARMMNRTAGATEPAALMLEKGGANPLLRNSAVLIGSGD